MTSKKLISCSKEKELGEMAADIRNIKTDMTEMKKDSKEILSCIHALKEELPTTYATKKEVEQLRKDLIARDINQDNNSNKKWSWIANNWDKIIYMIAMSVIGIILLYKGGLL